MRPLLKNRLSKYSYIAIGSLILGTGTYQIYTKKTTVHANSKGKSNENDDHFKLGKKNATTIAAPDSELKIKINKNNVIEINNCPNQCNSTFSPNSNSTLSSTITSARSICQKLKSEHCLPGLVVGVSVNGKLVWEEGFGYADLENQVEMSPETVLRIASISKSITMTMLGKLMEQELIDIDLPIHKYLDTGQFPKEGEKSLITTRHLLSHTSGIRHYDKKEDLDKDTKKAEMSKAEYFLKDKFQNVDKAMELFKNDELIFTPGTKYHYSTHGFTVVSAIIEKLTKTPFETYAKNMFKFWGMKNTYLDQNEPIIYNRGRTYTLDEKNLKIQNSPYVDNSYKWAGGGFLSTVGDLIKFSHILLSSFQNAGPGGESSNAEPTTTTTTTCPPAIPASPKLNINSTPFLSPSTLTKLWTPHPLTSKPNTDYLYALGFVVGPPMRNCLYCKERDFMHVEHSGGAIGASSVLHIAFPKEFKNNNSKDSENKLQVKGVVVVMMTNLTDKSLSNEAREISELFKWGV